MRLVNVLGPPASVQEAKRCGARVHVPLTPRPYAWSPPEARHGVPRVCPAHIGRRSAPPPPPSRTKWTRLVHPSVLIGHVSSTIWADGGARAGRSWPSRRWAAPMCRSAPAALTAPRASGARLTVHPRPPRKAAACPVCTGGGTRRVRFVRGDGRGVSSQYAEQQKGGWGGPSSQPPLPEDRLPILVERRPAPPRARADPRRGAAGRLPDADKGTKPGTIAHIRDIFYRMGMNDQVASPHPPLLPSPVSDHTLPPPSLLLPLPMSLLYTPSVDPPGRSRK